MLRAKQMTEPSGSTFSNQKTCKRPDKLCKLRRQSSSRLWPRNLYCILGSMAVGRCAEGVQAGGGGETLDAGGLTKYLQCKIVWTRGHTQY